MARNQAAAEEKRVNKERKERERAKKHSEQVGRANEKNTASHPTAPMPLSRERLSRGAPVGFVWCGRSPPGRIPRQSAHISRHHHATEAVRSEQNKAYMDLYYPREQRTAPCNARSIYGSLLPLRATYRSLRTALPLRLSCASSLSAGGGGGGRAAGGGGGTAATARGRCGRGHHRARLLAAQPVGRPGPAAERAPAGGSERAGWC